MDFAEAHEILSSAGVQMDAGLSAIEFAGIERKFGFQFPPDLREFLSIKLPVSRSWLDWRGASTEVIQKRLDWPFESMCFDIRNNAFWLDEWGARPDDVAACIKIARQACDEAPRLIPIFSHRYLPASPHEAGNPVFSVYQTDIIYYGANLLDYLRNEFSVSFGLVGRSVSGTPKPIEFWSKLVER